MVDRNFVISSYFAILGRQPESNEIIEHWCNSNLSESQIVSSLYKSKERFVIDARNILSSSERDNAKRFMIIQTCDPDRYKEMLFSSMRYNSLYANKWGWEFSVYIGLKIGCHPFHATLNRIFLLSELVDQGYDGWCMYLDADCVITNPLYDVKKLLLDLNVDTPFYFLNHDRISSPNYKWWYVNAGAFIFDLSSFQSRSLVKAWKNIYSSHDNEYFKSVGSWGNLFNDQESLHSVLRSRPEIENNIYMDYLYDSFVTQFGRLEEDPSDSDILARIERIKSAGINSYGSF